MGRPSGHRPGPNHSSAFRPGARDAADCARRHLQPHRADKLILLARRLEELPRIEEAFHQGEIPWTKTREIARVASEETEEEWLELALRATSRELEETVRGVRRGDWPGGGLKARRTKYRQSLLLSGAEKAIWDQGLRQVMAELGPGATPAQAAVGRAERALSSDRDGEAAAGRRPGEGPFLVVYHRGRDGRCWVEGSEGPLEIEPEALEARVRTNKRA